MKPRIHIALITEHEYGCSNYRIDASIARSKDTIRIVVRGLAPKEMCDNGSGPARLGLPLKLSNGTYQVQIRQGGSVDSLMLSVSPARLQLHASGVSLLTLPDTTPFWRPPAQSFALVCYTYNVPALCADIDGWIRRQAGVAALVFPAGGRHPFASSWGDSPIPDQNYYRYYAYGDQFDLPKLRRCMKEVSRRVEEAVGVVIEVSTAAGERMRAWSTRSNHERHIETPTSVTDSPAC